MKIFKQISALLLSAMILCTTSNVAYAAEMPIDTETVIASYDFELTPDMREGEIALMANVDNTFNVYGSHTGSTRNYYGNKLKYTVTITDANGNAANNILAIQLFSSGGSKISEEQFWANGSLNGSREIPISYGGSYYFKYVQAYGDLRTLRVHMVITAYN